MRATPGTRRGRGISASSHPLAQLLDSHLPSAAPPPRLEKLEDRLLLTASCLIEPSGTDAAEPITVQATAALTASATSALPTGDANGDGVVDSRDIAPFISALTGSAGSADVNGDGVVNILDVTALTSAVTASAVAQPNLSEPLPMGVNLSAVNDWNREWPFADAFKTSRDWIATRPDGSWVSGTVLVDSNGWPILQPGQGAGTLMFREVDGHYPSGTYVCTFEGDGDLTFSYDAKQTVRKSANRYEFTVQPGNDGIFLNITRSNSANPVRNIHVWMPGLENAASPFHPLFLERLRPFGVIRFMEWQQTNGSSQIRWSDRAQMSDARQSSAKGVAYEYIIQLCNELNVDPWICVPHQADDDYVRQMAALFHDQLKPGLKVYLEYSNEIWNYGFPQGNYVEGLPGTWMQAAAERIASTFKAWSEVWGTQSNRLVRIVAGQKNNPWLTKELVRTIYTTYGGIFDAVSCSGYIGPSAEAKAGYNASTTPQQILADTHDYTVNHNLPEQIAAHASLADQYTQLLGRPIQFLVYEGGQHIDLGGDANKPYAQAYYQVQSDPGMYSVYQEMMRGFRNLGGDLFCVYTFAGKQESKYGSWGQLDYQDQPLEQAPKYAATVNASLGVLDGDPRYMTYSLSRQTSLAADVNGDGVVNSLDLLSLIRVLTQNTLAADTNGDGVVNALDLAPFATAVKTGSNLALAASSQSEVMASFNVEAPAASSPLDLGVTRDDQVSPAEVIQPVEISAASAPRYRSFSAWQMLMGVAEESENPLGVVRPANSFF